MGHAHGMKLGALLLVLVLGCGGGADAPPLGPDAGSGGSPVGGSTGTGGAAGAGADASTGTGGIGVSDSGTDATPALLTAAQCLIPVSGISAPSESAMITVTGPVPYNAARAVQCQSTYSQPVTPEIIGGQVTSGAWWTGWAEASYSIHPSTSEAACVVTIKYTCAGCAGSCGDGNLTVGPFNAIPDGNGGAVGQ